MMPVQFQLLTSQVEIATGSAEVRRALAYLAQDVVHAFVPTETIRYDVTDGDAGTFDVVQGGAAVEAGLTAMQVMETIYTHCHEIAHSRFPKHMRLHAGSATIGGRRAAFVGQKEVGKTTLMLRMVFDGMEVHADELLLIMDDGRTLPFPRRFHVKPSTFQVMRELLPLEAKMSCAISEEGERIYGFAPSDIGNSWHIDYAPLDAVFFLQPNHGGATSVHPIAKAEAVERVRSQITFPERSPLWAASFMKFVAGVKFFVLSNGEPHASVDAVRQVCEGL